MHERTHAIGRIVGLVLATASIVLAVPVQDTITQNLQTKTADKPIIVPTTVKAKAMEAVAVKTTPAEPPKPAPWSVDSSPNGGTELVNKAIALYQSMGLTKQGTAMIVGNFLQEKSSAFVTGEPCGGTAGDGGLAMGFGQWHPGRRTDMPCGFNEQLTWAVNIEMVRDDQHNGGHSLSGLLRDPNATPEQLDRAIYLWERYGHKGLRYEYGIALLNQLND